MTQTLVSLVGSGIHSAKSTLTEEQSKNSPTFQQYCPRFYCPKLSNHKRIFSGSHQDYELYSLLRFFLCLNNQQHHCMYFISIFALLQCQVTQSVSVFLKLSSVETEFPNNYRYDLYLYAIFEFATNLASSLPCGFKKL